MQSHVAVCSIRSRAEAGTEIELRHILEDFHNHFWCHFLRGLGLEALYLPEALTSRIKFGVPPFGNVVLSRMEHETAVLSLSCLSSVL
jgi:hypothetical protein